MAIKDYNSIAFKNSAIDRLSGRFGKGPGDGGLKKASAVSTPSVTLNNPWSQPKVTAVSAPAVNRTPSKLMPAATPSTNVSTESDKTMAPAPAAKTVKDVRAENRLKKAEAKGNAAVTRINQKAAMTPEQKSEKRKKVGSAIKSGIEWGLGTIGTAVGTYSTIKNARD